MTALNAPWKAFKPNGKHVIDEKWYATHESNHSTVHAPVKNSRGVTIALVVAHGRWAELPDITPTCRLIAAAPELLADLREAAETLRKYEALHRAKGTADSDAKADVNAEKAARFEATIAKATGEKA